MGLLTAGLDVGQVIDPSALVVVEREDRPAARPLPGGRATDEHYVVRFVERLPLGLSYPAIVARVVEVGRGVRERAGAAPRLFIDQTGVGRPVLDLLLRSGYPGSVRGVAFVAGDNLRQQHDGAYSWGKGDLVSRTQVNLQAGLLHFPATREAEALARELIDYRTTIAADGHDTFGARSGAHDDLVVALALACIPVRRWVPL